MIKISCKEPTLYNHQGHTENKNNSFNYIHNITKFTDVTALYVGLVSSPSQS